MKIAIGLSGGVDSSVAAWLLKEQGHEVMGLTMKIWDNSFKSSNTKNACFGPDEEKDIEEAAALCKRLDLPYHVVDLSREYVRDIIGYVRDEYMSGRTPNPCIKCNQQMKFSFLIERARESGLKFEKFATGHYANVEYDEARGRFLLKRGVDEKKDQSYFLSLLGQDQLSNILFPLGHYRKPEVKEIAKKMGFPAYEKKESQDFFSGDYEELLDLTGLPDQGDIVDLDGKVLGRHKGFCHYTIGQRRGLGVSHSEPLYVVGIDKDRNRVIVGTDELLLKRRILVSNVNWIASASAPVPFECTAKIRYAHKPARALVTPLEGNTARIEFSEPQRAIAPGQFAVCYEGDIVSGGGIIEGVEG
jgi:tRNA-uridine 2-sulfurtransferase